MRIGIDLGGTKTEIMAVAADGREVLRRREASPQGDYQATLALLIDLIEAAEQQLGVQTSIGIGIPGTESRDSGLIKNANSTWLIGRPLRADLEQRLGRPVRLANDANCFALSEASDGAAAGAGVVFGVILGTGVGGGIVINGQVLTGSNGIAGEWGHCYLPPLLSDDFAGPGTTGPSCYCGRHGCVETWLSGPALVADHLRCNGASLQPEAIARAAAAGDTTCEATLQRYETRLAFALAQVINVLDPEVIVLGGGLSNLERLYVNVPSLWGAYVFSDTVQTQLRRHRHGDSSGVRGAAWLWPLA